jgi:hypothetical protein
MDGETNITDERLRPYIRLLTQANAGQLDSLECPGCGRMAVSVWFTCPAVNTYRTWFICSDCEFHTRVQDTQKPPFFSEDRVSTDLQERDLMTLKQSRFKRPPQQLM